MKNWSVKGKKTLVYFVSFAAFAGLSILLNLLRFKGVIDWFYVSHFFGISSSVPFGKIAMALILPYVIAEAFGKAFWRETTPKDPRGTKAMTSLVLLLLLTALIIVMNSASGIKFYEDKAAFGGRKEALIIREVRYEDLEIYQVEEYEFHLPSKYYHSKDYYPYNGNAYAVSDGKGHYFDFGVLSEDDAMYQQLMDIAEQYDKEIKPIQHITFYG